jgi:hypothetical protein
VTTLRKIFSLYSLLTVVVGASAAILVFVHQFGNAGADTVAGSILGGISLVAFVGHAYLASVRITVPSNVLAALTWVSGIAVTLVAAGGVIVQYVGAVSPALTPWVAVALQGFALVGSLIAGLLHAQVASKAASLRLPFVPQAAR